MRRSATLSRVITYAGIDYHKKFSMVTFGDQSGKVILTQRVPNDRHTIEQFFKDAKGATCAVESCRGYEWFVDLLKELGMNVLIANPYEVSLISRSRCKTDKVDSKILMELLAMGFLPTCYQPTANERKLRERLRWRCHLVRNATRIKLRIHSLLDKENLGIQSSNMFKGKARAQLEVLHLRGPGRQDLLRKHLKLLEQIEKMLLTEDHWVRDTARINPDAQLLMTVPGIGEISAMVILSELGDVSRFKRSGQVVNYAGLVPSLHQSASSRYNGPITKQGPALLRWVLVQDAWKAIKFCPQLRQFFTSVSRRCGRHGAIVATARKLLEIAYRVLRDRKPFDANLVGKQSA